MTDEKKKEFTRRLAQCNASEMIVIQYDIFFTYLEDAFAVLVALVVMVSIKWVGILIINAMLILPAAPASNISENLREYHFFAVLFAAFSGVSGLITSYYTNVASGPMIVIVAAVIYFGTYLYSRHYR